MFPEQDEERQKRRCEGEAITTSQRMEMTAIIECLKLFPNKDIILRIVSDSQYCIDGITTHIHKWQINGWLASNKKPVKNKDLWLEMYDLVHNRKAIKIYFKKVKGHSGDKYNDIADDLADQGVKKVEKRLALQS